MKIELRGFFWGMEEKLERVDQNRLARECEKLDPAFEKALAEEGLSEELTEWPEY